MTYALYCSVLVSCIKRLAVAVVAYLAAVFQFSGPADTREQSAEHTASVAGALERGQTIWKSSDSTPSNYSGQLHIKNNSVNTVT